MAARTAGVDRNEEIMSLSPHVLTVGFPRFLESPGFLFVKFPGHGKSWKMCLVLESPGNFSARSWKVLEFSCYDAGADAKIYKNSLRFYLYI